MFSQDIYKDDIPDVFKDKNITTSFPAFWFHAEPNGFLWIGEFLLQWVQSRGNKVHFMLDFDIPIGTYSTSYALNTGGDSKVSPLFHNLTQHGVELQGTRCEHPQFTLSYGIKFQNKHYTRITINSQDSQNKPAEFRRIAQPVRSYYIPPQKSPNNACPEIQRDSVCTIS